MSIALDLPSFLSELTTWVQVAQKEELLIALPRISQALSMASQRIFPQSVHQSSGEKISLIVRDALRNNRREFIKRSKLTKSDLAEIECGLGGKFLEKIAKGMNKPVSHLQELVDADQLVGSRL